MSEKSSESVIKKNVAPRELRRGARKDFRYIEQLEEPGSLYNAEVHGSAQRLLKVHRITKYVKFCRDCSMPQETPGVVVPFNWFDEQLDYGLGIYLYFYYIKFLIVMSLICAGLSSVSTIVFSKDYASDIKDYCQKYVGNETLRLLASDNGRYTFANLSSDCSKYISGNTTDEDVFKADWLSDMSCYNLDSYYNVFKYQATMQQRDNINSVILDFSFMYFLTGITVLIANFLFIQIVSLFSEYEDFKATTPGDYAVLVRGVPKPVGDEKMRDPLVKLVKRIEKHTVPLDIYQILPCLRIDEIYKVAKKKYKEETKLYHVNHFEKQLKLNKDNHFSKENNNLHYFEDRLICFTKKTPITEIEAKVEKYKNKLDEMQLDLNQNPNKYNGGTFFLIFNNIQMKDEFAQFFPKSYFLKFMWRIRYFFENIICQICINEGRRERNTLKISLDVEKDIEPYEVEWENMGFSRGKRNLLLLLSILAFVVLIIVTLGVIIALNYLQRKIKEKQKNFWEYVISFLISIILAVVTVIGKFIFKKLTFMEKIEVKTYYYISYSIKLTLFTFLTIAVLPVISNYIFGLDGSDILVNNLLMIFITDIFLPPVLFYLGPDLAIKLFKRSKARLDLKNVKLEKSTYTQRELNEIFENPEMDICAKYSYINNVFLISLFYMSIFPIGMIFGFGALIFAYISEFFYIGLYKRPEVLNSSLCRFYVSNFKWAIFVFAIGNYIFLAPINKDQRISWALINLIVFFVLCLIPYQSFKFNTLGETEGRSKPETYEQNYYFFSTDYEKLNPFTRKQAYTNYFDRLMNDKIIEPKEGKRIINKIQSTNDITGYVNMRRHADNHAASQEMNNIYMKNKNDPKIHYMFGSHEENKAGFSLGGLKNLIMETSELKEDKMTNEELEEIRKMKENLDDFSLTNTGICNALIFLDEKHNINDEFENANFNPWKAEWIYSPEYKRKRRQMIRDIRSSMDFRGEISDDEDSIIKYEDKREFITQKIKLMNEQILAEKKSSGNAQNDDNKEIINNNELTLENTKLRNSLNSSNLKKGAEEEDQKIEIKNGEKKAVQDNDKNNSINDSELKLINKISLFPKNNEENKA